MGFSLIYQTSWQNYDGITLAWVASLITGGSERFMTDNIKCGAVSRHTFCQVPAASLVTDEVLYQARLIN